MKALATRAIKKNKLRQPLSIDRKRAVMGEKHQTFAVIGIEQFANKVDFICRNVKYPEAFIKDLIKSLRAVSDNGSIQPLCDCIASWEATAELDSVPATRQRIIATYAALKSGRSKTINSRKKFLALVNA